MKPSRKKKKGAAAETALPGAHVCGNISLHRGYKEVRLFRKKGAAPLTFFHIMGRHPALAMMGVLCNEIIKHKVPESSIGELKTVLHVSANPVTPAYQIEIQPEPGASEAVKNAIKHLFTEMLLLGEEEIPDLIFSLSDETCLAARNEASLLEALQAYVDEHAIETAMEKTDMETLLDTRWREKGSAGLKDPWVLAALPAHSYATKDELLAQAFRTANARFTYTPEQIMRVIKNSGEINGVDPSATLPGRGDAPAPVWH